MALQRGDDPAKYAKQIIEAGIKLVYIFVEPDDIHGQKNSTLAGGKLMDRRLTFRKNILPSEKKKLSDTVISIKGEKSQTAWELLAHEAGKYSRFKIDKKFPNGTFETLFALWLHRSLSGEIADEVFGHRGEAGMIDGIISVKERSGNAQIGLIAVAESARGKSIGSELVDASIDFCIDHNLKKIDVITQRDNSGACRFYEKIGFSLFAEQYVYHLWL